MVEHKMFLYSMLFWDFLSLLGFIIGQRIYLNTNVSSILKGHFSVAITIIFAIFEIYILIATGLFLHSHHSYAALFMIFVFSSPFLISSKTSGLKTADKELYLQILILFLCFCFLLHLA